MAIVSFNHPNGKLANLKNRLIDTFDKIPDPKIILGDGNGHHTIWDSRINIARGSTIFENATETGLCVLNDGCKTFIRGRVETSIDISLASHNIIDQLLGSVDNDLSGSDHFTSQYGSNLTHHRQKPPVDLAGSMIKPLGKSSKTEWRKFWSLLLRHLSINSRKASSRPLRRPFRGLVPPPGEGPFVGGLKLQRKRSKQDAKHSA